MVDPRLASARSLLGPDDDDQDPEVDPRLARLRRRFRERQEALTGFLEREGYTNVNERLRPKEPNSYFAEGAKAGFTLDHAGQLRERSALGVEAPEPSIPERIKYGAGYLAGSIPLAVATGLGARVAAGAASKAPALARTMPGLSRALGAVSKPVPSARSAARVAARESLRGGAAREAAEKAGRAAARGAVRRTAAQNVTEGLAYSALTEPLRELPEGVSRGEAIAYGTGLGGAIDLVAGLALGRYGAAAPTPLRRGRRRGRTAYEAVHGERYVPPPRQGPQRAPADYVPPPDESAPQVQLRGVERPEGALPSAAEVAARRANRGAQRTDAEMLEEAARRRRELEGRAETPLILTPEGVPARTGQAADVQPARAPWIERPRSLGDEADIQARTAPRLLPPPDETARESARSDPRTGEILEETRGGPLIRPGEPGEPYVPPPDREPMLVSRTGGLVRRGVAPDEAAEETVDPRLASARQQAARASVEQEGRPTIDVVESGRVPEPDAEVRPEAAARAEPAEPVDPVADLRERAAGLKPKARGIVDDALNQDDERNLVAIAANLREANLSGREAEEVLDILTEARLRLQRSAQEAEPARLDAPEPQEPRPEAPVAEGTGQQPRAAEGEATRRGDGGLSPELESLAELRAATRRPGMGTTEDAMEVEARLRALDEPQREAVIARSEELVSEVDPITGRRAEAAPDAPEAEASDGITRYRMDDDSEWQVGPIRDGRYLVTHWDLIEKRRMSLGAERTFNSREAAEQYAREQAGVEASAAPRAAEQPREATLEAVPESVTKQIEGATSRQLRTVLEAERRYAGGAEWPGGEPPYSRQQASARVRAIEDELSRRGDDLEPRQGTEAAEQPDRGPLLDANVGVRPEIDENATRWPLRKSLEERPAGRETPIQFADGTRASGRYRLVEASELTPSHDPVSFRPNEGYVPRGNNRQYQLGEGTAARQQFEQRQTAYDPAYPLDPTRHVANGPPVIRPDGLTVGGNDRAMHIQERYRRGEMDYLDQLRNDAETFGFSREQVEAMDQPVLVREVTDEAIDLEDVAEFRRVNQLSDVQPGKAKDPVSRAEGLAEGLRQSRDALEHLAETMGDEQSLRAYLRTAAGREFGDIAQRDGVIGADRLGEMRNLEDGTWTDLGVDDMEAAIQALAIGDADLVYQARRPAEEGGIRSVLNQLDHAYPAMARAAALREDFSLQEPIQDALRLHLELRGQPAESNIGSIQQLVDPSFGDQTSMLARSDNPKAVRLAEFIEQANKKETKLAFRHYAKIAAESERQLANHNMFGRPPVSADEAFEMAFGRVPDVKPVDVPRIGDRGDEGFVVGSVARSMGGGVAGGIAGGFVGDTPEERIQNMMVGAGIGMGVGIARSRAKNAFKGIGHMSMTEAARRNADRIFLQAHDYIRKHGGAAGHIIADDLQDMDQWFSRREGIQLDDMFQFYRDLSRDEVVTVNKLINSRTSVADAPQELRDIADELRIIWDRDLEDYRALGGERIVGGEWVTPKGSGKAFPQLPNELGAEVMERLRAIGTSDDKVQDMAQAMVDEGLADNMKHAIARLEGYRQAIEDSVVPYADTRQTGLNKYLGTTRFELPEEYVDWSLDGVRGAVRRNAMAIEGMKKWGVDHKELRPFLAQIEQDAGKDVRNDIERFLAHEFGVGGEEDIAGAKFFGAWSNLETAQRLGVSPLSIQLQYGQQFTNLAHLPLDAQLKALKDYPPFFNRWIKDAQELRKWAERSGQVRGRSALADIHSAKGQKLADRALTGFLAGVRSNERRSAIMARFALESDIKRVMEAHPKETGPLRAFLTELASPGTVYKDAEGNLAGPAVRRLEKLNISRGDLADMIANGEQLTENQMQSAAYRLVHDTQFPVTLASKPIWWNRHPFWRLAFKFKTFGARQTGYIYENVVKEATHGNVAPLAKFVATSMLFGELYHISRDLLLGSDKSLTVAAVREGGIPDDIGHRLWVSFYRQGGMGMLMDLQYGISDWVIGPAGSTLANLGHTAVNFAKSENAIDALRSFATEQIPATRQAVGVKRRFEERINSQMGDFFAHQTIREKTIRWQDQQGSVGERFTDEFERWVTGGPEFGFTGNTLAFRNAGTALQAGNVEKAAKHLEGVFASADADEDPMQSIRQSMRSKSPMGGLTQEQQRAFLASLPREQRAEAMRLQDRWESRYDQAVRLARSNARRR